MATFLQYVLYLHILAGFTALVVGLVPMFSQKGGKAHILWGKVYYWAMCVVALTALLRFKPEVRLVFLGCIAVFSFYNTFTGVRLINLKNKVTQAGWQDWLGAYLALGCSVLMGAYAVYVVVAYSNLFFGILFTVFGAFCMLLAVTDLLIFSGKKSVEKLHWLYGHISRMGGSYIATVTAFVVVNNKGLVPDLMAWIAPGVIGGIIIGRVTKAYKKKAA